ncbi:MAG: signal recognition particle-docking protein FtsY [Clostridia bacterium]|nr:signal recognition particle-docking protein FtsY [Clostridia bacterium]
MGIFNKKVSFGLKKTRDNLQNNIDDVLDTFDAIEDDLYEELTEILIVSDVGAYTSQKIIDRVKEKVKERNVHDKAEVKKLIEEVITELLGPDETIDFVTVPAVVLVIGVNGVGKTTTIGKMAAYFKSQGKNVILGAADTFRAAAIDQLGEWANRAGVDMVKQSEGSDPAAVVFDTINAGKSRNADVIICDTAGRLHNKKNLMEELNKIYKVIDRELPYSDREIFLVLDATTGQNAVNQAKEFMQVADISGIILTKLDGTAKGGIVLTIRDELNLPVKFIGVGEQIDDMLPFKSSAYAKSLFNEDETIEDLIKEEEKEVKKEEEKEEKKKFSFKNLFK